MSALSLLNLVNIFSYAMGTDTIYYSLSIFIQLGISVRIPKGFTLPCNLPAGLTGCGLAYLFAYGGVVMG